MQECRIGEGEMFQAVRRLFDDFLSVANIRDFTNVDFQ